jgi:hypothetical protein
MACFGLSSRVCIDIFLTVLLGPSG